MSTPSSAGWPYCGLGYRAEQGQPSYRTWSAPAWHGSCVPSMACAHGRPAHAGTCRILPPNSTVFSTRHSASKPATSLNARLDDHDENTSLQKDEHQLCTSSGSVAVARIEPGSCSSWHQNVGPHGVTTSCSKWRCEDEKKEEKEEEGEAEQRRR